MLSGAKMSTLAKIYRTSHPVKRALPEICPCCQPCEAM